MPLLIGTRSPRASVRSKDKETLDWFVHQHESEPTKFAIVERFAHESSQKYHLENPVSRRGGVVRV